MFRWVSSFLCGCLTATALATALAAEPAPLAFHDVTPGKTTEQELLNHATWKPLLKTLRQPDGAKFHEFRFGVWRKVTVVARDGVVRLIDAVPPERAPADKLAEALELGKLDTGDRRALPAGVWQGPEVEAGWQVLQPASGAAILLFTTKDDAKQYVRQVRLYPTPAGPENLFVSKAGRYAVLMRGEPKNLPAGVFFPVKKALYTAVFTDHPADIEKKTDPETVLDRDRDRRIGSVGRLISERKIRLDSYPGRDFVFESPFVGGEKYVYRKYLFLVGARLYHVVVSAPKVEGLPPDAERFLNSFRLVP